MALGAGHPLGTPQSRYGATGGTGMGLGVINGAGVDGWGRVGGRGWWQCGAVGGGCGAGGQQAGGSSGAEGGMGVMGPSGQNGAGGTHRTWGGAGGGLSVGDPRALSRRVLSPVPPSCRSRCIKPSQVRAPPAMPQPPQCPPPPPPGLTLCPSPRFHPTPDPRRLPPARGQGALPPRCVIGGGGSSTTPPSALHGTAQPGLPHTSPRSERGARSPPGTAPRTDPPPPPPRTYSSFGSSRPTQPQRRSTVLGGQTPAGGGHAAPPAPMRRGGC